MVSINFSKTVKVDGDPLVLTEYIKAAGLSTDAKPTGNIAVGSEFIEVDTGKKYLYTGTEWSEVNA